MKKKVCLVADVPGWAFDMIAQKVKKDLNYKYDIRIDYFDVYTEPENLYECIERNRDCDLIHFFWRKALLQMESETFKQKVEINGINVKEYIEQIKPKMSSCVYDFLYLKEEETEQYKNVFNNYISHYYVCTQKLYDIYQKIEKYRKPDMVVYDICDGESFKPLNLERFEYKNIENRAIYVGWVGNGARKVAGIDLKGLHSIIKPVMEGLKTEGYDIQEHYADRNERWRTIDEMPQYYSEIDVCLCMSIHEGTPRPALEAMYSGVPIISTDVGLVSEALGEKQKEFIIGDRENGKNDEEIRKKLKEKIIYLYNNRHLFKELSDENMISIEKFDGGKTIKAFEVFFDMALKNNR
mgnify:CR=1 FL=1